MKHAQEVEGWALDEGNRITQTMSLNEATYVTVAKGLQRQHARSVRICRQARMLKFHGLRDTDTNEWLDGYEAACCDILTALQRGRGGKG